MTSTALPLAIGSPADPPSVMPAASWSEMKQEEQRRWVNRYCAEWQRIARGRVDQEYTCSDGYALFHFVGHRPPEEIARLHFSACTSADELAIPPEAKFLELAQTLGLVQRGESLSAAQKDFAFGVAELCAVVADKYRHPRDGCAGDHIRATFCALPF